MIIEEVTHGFKVLSDKGDKEYGFFNSFIDACMYIHENGSFNPDMIDVFDDGSRVVFSNDNSEGFEL